MSLMPWTARKLLWNPEPMGKEFGIICLEAFDLNPNDFGRTVMNLLVRDYGISYLNEALTVEAKNRPALAKSLRWKNNVPNKTAIPKTLPIGFTIFLLGPNKKYGVSLEKTTIPGFFDFDKWKWSFKKYLFC